VAGASEARLQEVGKGLPDGRVGRPIGAAHAVRALASAQTANAGQQLQNGIGIGVGKALDRLSQYYIGLAEKLFPIIEVDAGRTVEVVFTKGFSLETNKQDSTGTYSDLWKRARSVMGDAVPMNDVNQTNP